MGATLGRVVEERVSSEPSLCGRFRLKSLCFFSTEDFEEWLASADADTEVVQVSLSSTTAGDEAFDTVLVLYRVREGASADA